MKLSLPPCFLLAILLLPQISFGMSITNEIVVKPYNDEWVLVRKDAFDFYINEIVTWKTKFERSEDARLSERERLLIERNSFHDLYSLQANKTSILEAENLRLNVVIGNLQAASNMKNWALVASLLGNIIQVIR